MTLNEYFKLASSPRKESLVGKLMQMIVTDEPGTDFEFARQQAELCLLKASGKKSYRIMSPKQDAASRASVAKRMGRG